MVPVLELDDGTQIGEAMAIAQYFEDIIPKPKLMGVDAKDWAIVSMWEKRANEEGMFAASELFRNTHPSFERRGLPGAPDPIPESPNYVTAVARLGRFFAKFNDQLAYNEFVAGGRWTVADATTLGAVDFAGWSDVRIPGECSHLQRWYDAVNAWASAKA